MTEVDLFAVRYLLNGPWWWKTSHRQRFSPNRQRNAPIVPPLRLSLSLQSHAERVLCQGEKHAMGFSLTRPDWSRFSGRCHRVRNLFLAVYSPNEGTWRLATRLVLVFQSAVSLLNGPWWWEASHPLPCSLLCTFGIAPLTKHHRPLRYQDPPSRPPLISLGFHSG